eukprot:TRINITY_DN7848_c0_g1_i2.p1 TRINITY_DN7848_c0_g1~~TRINITY_DN7848_c0_g1_i2.p1  ORF type:complete len:618 (+),score=105.59 TRINITY_DN7848_c0_g1_i2:141-1994(+)
MQNTSDKFQFQIPHTILLDGCGHIDKWLFTSKDGVVLKRSPQNSSVASIKRLFLEESTKDNDGSNRIVSVAWKGGECEYYTLKEFLSFCDQLAQVEDGEQDSLPPNAPDAIQVYIQPQFEHTFVAHCRMHNGAFTCDVDFKPHPIRKSKTLPQGETLTSRDPPTEHAQKEIQQSTRYLHQYLAYSHQMDPANMVVEYFYDRNGRIVLSQIILVEFRAFDRHTPTDSRPTSASATFYDRSQSSLQNWRHPTRGTPISSRSPHNSSRASTYTPISTMSTISRPRTAPSRATTQSFAPSVYSMATYRGPSRASTRSTEGNYIMQLTKEMDACKSQLSIVRRDLLVFQEQLKERQTYANAVESEYRKLKSELDVVESEKKELSNTLVQIWTEAKSQGKDMRGAEKQLVELDNKMNVFLQEKDSVAHRLSGEIVQLKAKIEEKAQKLAEMQGDNHEMQLKISDVQGHIHQLQELKTAEIQRVTDMQNLLATRERELRLRMDRTDRIRADIMRRDASVRVRSNVIMPRGSVSSRKSTLSDDASEETGSNAGSIRSVQVNRESPLSSVAAVASAISDEHRMLMDDDATPSARVRSSSVGRRDRPVRRQTPVDLRLAPTASSPNP